MTAVTVRPRGTASRSFETSQSGIVTVTLTASDVAMGIGIGIPRAANGGCRLTISEVDSAGVSLSLPADTGSYCVQVFDDGSVAGPSNFAIQIVYP